METVMLRDKIRVSRIWVGILLLRGGMQRVIFPKTGVFCSPFLFLFFLFLAGDGLTWRMVSLMALTNRRRLVPAGKHRIWRRVRGSLILGPWARGSHLTSPGF